MANIYDVAKQAGVSRSAVSRVLNNQKGVHPDKRARVMEAVKELNYRPNSMARGLAMKKTNTIGVVARELADTFYSEFIRSINHHADQKHYGALYCVRNNYLATNVDYLSTLSAKVDGYIFLGENTVSERELQTLVNTNTPVIAMEFKYDVEGVTFLTINNYRETIKGMEYLIGLGHRKIIHIGLDPNVNEFEDREKGYQEMVFKHQLGYSKVFRADYNMMNTIELGGNLVPTLEKDQATAIFCANDSVAIGIKQGLIQAGYEKEVAILGFDGIFSKGYNALPVTKFATLKQPQDEMGKYAIESIVRLIEGEKEDYSKEFECSLITE